MVKKNPAAVALGHLRALSMTAKKRSDIARMGAIATNEKKRLKKERKSLAVANEVD